MSGPSEPAFPRRRLLMACGAVATGVAGCALLRGGAGHQVYEAPPSALQGDLLRVPRSALVPLEPGQVLQLEPGSNHPPLLITPKEDATYLVVTAKCTHRGCVVGFHPLSREWRCPCHGSRFAVDGAVIEGPAERPLTTLPAHVEEDAVVIELAGLKAG